MTNNEIVTHLYNDRTVRRILRNMNIEPVDFDDLESEIYVQLLTYDNGKLNQAYHNNGKAYNNNSQINNIIASIAKNLYYSTTSFFYAKYRRLRKTSKSLSYIDTDEINNIVNEMTDEQYQYKWEQKHKKTKGSEQT